MKNLEPQDLAAPPKSGFRLSFLFLLHVALVSQYIRMMKHTFLVPSSMLINLLLNLPQGGSVVESLKSTPPHAGFKQPSLWNRCQTGLRSSRRQNHIHLGYLKNKQTYKKHCIVSVCSYAQISSLYYTSRSLCPTHLLVES